MNQLRKNQSQPFIHMTSDLTTCRFSTVKPIELYSCMIPPSMHLQSVHHCFCPPTRPYRSPPPHSAAEHNFLRLIFHLQAAYIYVHLSFHPPFYSSLSMSRVKNRCTRLYVLWVTYLPSAYHTKYFLILWIFFMHGALPLSLLTWEYLQYNIEILQKLLSSENFAITVRVTLLYSPSSYCFTCITTTAADYVQKSEIKSGNRSQ